MNTMERNPLSVTLKTSTMTVEISSLAKAADQYSVLVEDFETHKKAQELHAAAIDLVWILQGGSEKVDSGKMNGLFKIFYDIYKDLSAHAPSKSDSSWKKTIAWSNIKDCFKPLEVAVA